MENLTSDEMKLVAVLIKALRAIAGGSGYGKLTINVSGTKVIVLRSEETFSFERGGDLNESQERRT